ncbi:hypothetical protein BDF19DRAFT_463926 [Syncephalis fuscata]|nr:hypothetical protein BDF19DRAFT_463926 [Syncephalis fuscata]
MPSENTTDNSPMLNNENDHQDEAAKLNPTATKRARESPSSPHLEQSGVDDATSECSATSSNDTRDRTRHSESGPSPKVAASYGFEFGNVAAVAVITDSTVVNSTTTTLTSMQQQELTEAIQIEPLVVSSGSASILSNDDAELDATLERQLASAVTDQDNQDDIDFTQWTPSDSEESIATDEPIAPYPPTEVAPSPVEQLTKVTPLINRPMHAGDTWYLITKKWIGQWRSYCHWYKVSANDHVEGDVSDPSAPSLPGPIDNYVLFDNENCGQLAVMESPGDIIDYVPEDAWYILTSWYGCNTPAIKRKIIQEADNQPGVVELYPPVYTLLRVALYKVTGSVNTIQLSKQNTIGQLEAKVKKVLKITTPIRLYNVPESLSKDAVTIAATRLSGLQRISDDPTQLLWHEPFLNQSARIAVETPKVDGGWLVSDLPPLMNSSVVNMSSHLQLYDDDDDDDAADDENGTMDIEKMFSQNTFQKPTSSSSNSSTKKPSFSISYNYNNGSSKSSYHYDHYGYGGLRKRTGPVGTTGLQNLGNTCFMNSALQCLSNTRSMTKFFLDGTYRDDINRDNPLGMQGRIADVYGDLLRRIWRGESSSMAPRDFKSVLQRFAPQFSGYQQHDSQEFIAFLLDGLHEDLNRVRVKPYVEIPDANGRPDEEVAAERWQMHKARNDSKVVDEFQGQYKSTLVCPDCNKVSVTFDPFMYLTLPVPAIKLRNIALTFVPLTPLARLSRQLELSMPASGTIRALKVLVGESMNVEPDKLEILEEFRSAIHHQFTNSEPVSQIQSMDVVYAYELPCAYPPPADSEWVVFTLLHQRQTQYRGVDLFGVPAIVAMPRQDTFSFDKLYRAVTCAAQRYTTANLFKITEEALEKAGDDEDEDDNANDETMNIDAKEPVELYQNTDIRPLRGLFKMSAVEDSYMIPSSYKLKSLACGYNTVQRNSLRDLVNPNATQDQSDTAAATTIMTVAATPSPSPSPPLIALSDDEAEVKSQDTNENDSNNDNDNSDSSDSSDSSDNNATEAAETMMDTELTSSLVQTGDTIVIHWADRACERLLAAGSYNQKKEELYPQSSAINAGTALWTVKESKHAVSASLAAPQGPLTLQRCLEEFTRAEQLSEDDSWYCPECKEHRQATKKFDLWRLPDTLVVHLKRFGQSRGWRDKIDELVEFPTEGLDLSEWVISEQDKQKPAIYDLYAVSNHFGGLGGGHYTAYAKNIATNVWYDFDDSTVTSMKEDQVMTRSAYLLFYKRREGSDGNDTDLGWLTNPASGEEEEEEKAAVAAAVVEDDAPMDNDDIMDGWGTQLPQSTYGPYPDAVGSTWSSNLSSAVPYVPNSSTKWMQDVTPVDIDATGLDSHSISSNNSSIGHDNNDNSSLDNLMDDTNYYPLSHSRGPSPIKMYEDDHMFASGSDIIAPIDLLIGVQIRFATISVIYCRSNCVPTRPLFSIAMLVLGVIIICAVALYLRISYKHPKLPITFLRNDRGAEEKTRVLFVTAHPDDECMFFSPTILALNRQPDVEIHLLCVTKGDHEGLGDQRMRELEKSCAVLGIDIAHVVVLDHPDFQDSPNARWNTALLGRIIEEHITRHQISRLITFDWRGISGHLNHVALERSVRHMLVTSHRLSSVNMPTYTLVTIPLLRKYAAMLDIMFSVPIRYVIGASLEREDDKLLFVASIDDYRRGVQAMREHSSQFVWFRQLYVIFSRYMYINVLHRVD